MGRTSSALFLLVIIPLQGRAAAGDFLAQPTANVDPAYVQHLIQSALASILGGGHGVEQSRLADINATISHLFNSLPQNERGLLSIFSMRYVVQRYFSQRYGWVVKGFDPQTSIRGNHGNDTLKSKTVLRGNTSTSAYVESIIEKSLEHGGFGIRDVVVAIATIETLILNENMKGLEASYAINRVPHSTVLQGREELISMLASYFIIEHLQGDSKSLKQHSYDKKHIHKYYLHWDDMLAFIGDTAGDVEWQHGHARNPFAGHSEYSWEDVSRTTKHFSQQYGLFSNHECQEMKERLTKIDVYETGRVRLSEFYRLSLDKSMQQQFLETEEYLSIIGALDTSSSVLGPQVIIPNYITGPNNCISNSLYHDVCCLNECDAMYMHLEAKIQRPIASAAEIKVALEGGITLAPVVSSSSPTEARNLSAPLLDRLQQIADYHNDRIPLHGRLFAQWLHYVYPRECPFPRKSGFFDLEKMEKLWDDASGHVSERQLAKLAAPAFHDPLPNAGEAMWTMWTMEEELIEPIDAPRPGLHFTAVLRFLAHALVLAAIGGTVCKEAVRLLDLQLSTGSTKKGDDLSHTVSYDI